jgi:hypothetical protein
MINANMRFYNYFTIGDKDAYGQATLPQLKDEPIGKIKIAIYESSQSVQDNINYRDCNYVGLTLNNIDDKMIIAYGKKRLKVLTVNSQGRYKQVFLKEV